MKVPLMMPVITEEMKVAARTALENEKLVLGESVYKFEEAFAAYTGTKHAVSTNSGTMALALGLHAVGVSRNDKVICPSMSFVATANSILHNNAHPTFVDVEDDTGNIDVGLVKIRDEKAILPVHLYGNMCDMDALRAIRETSGVPIVEDAAEAHGGMFRGKKAGNLGDIGCFSFYTTKNMTVGGDGGIITTNNEEWAEHIRKVANCGRKTKYEHDVLGYTARLNTINAAIGLVQLKHLDSWNENRRRAASIYSKLLPDDVQLTYGDGCAYYTYTMKLVDERARDALAEKLSQKDVGTGVYFPIPMHLQPLYRTRYGYSEGMCPVSESFAKKIISLPMFSTITEDQARYVAECVNEVL